MKGSPMAATAGLEVMKYRAELLPIIRKIVKDHIARNGCGFPEGHEEMILCNWAKGVERVEICKARAA